MKSQNEICIMTHEDLKENVRVFGVPMSQVPPGSGNFVSTLKSVPCKEEFDAYIESIHSSSDDTPKRPELRIVK
jgi:hypothetical protein